MNNKDIKICLFTDTFCDANGVSRFLQDMAKESLSSKVELNIITSTVKNYCPKLDNVFILKPFFRIKMPFYKELDLVFPPIRQMVKKVKELQPDVIHISTPGFIGIVGTLIALKHKIPVIGTYHTDFPMYIYSNTQLKLAKNITTLFMKIFYKKFTALVTRSQEYIGVINEDISIEKEKIFFLQPGTNIKTFSPKYYNNNLWENYNISQNSTKFLYVGRLTKEKNLDYLFEIWKLFYNQSKKKDSYLCLAGSGELENYKDSLKKYNVVFLGHKEKEELSSLYASSTVFVFPSTTDTLGQVVLESLASSTPVIVTNKGGPCGIVNNSKEQVGFVLDIEEKKSWIKLFKKFENGKLNQELLRKNSYIYSKNFSITKTFESFIDIHTKNITIKKG
ncbi:MAG: glycosyltransferase [Arcobacteraceae bacterium]|nr:glycosyltransferase [Arcobacteraceae bacterium]